MYMATSFVKIIQSFSIKDEKETQLTEKGKAGEENKDGEIDTEWTKARSKYCSQVGDYASDKFEADFQPPFDVLVNFPSQKLVKQPASD